MGQLVTAKVLVQKMNGLFSSIQEVYNMTAKKQIPYYKLGDGKKSKIVFDLSEVEEHIRSKRVETREEFKAQVLTGVVLRKNKLK